MKTTKENISPYIGSIVKFLKENKVHVPESLKIILRKDSKNAQEPLGNTAYCESHTNTVVLYTEERHIKDVLRSFVHEMIHIDQTHRLGELNVGTGNVNKSKFLEKLEADAYLRGNMLFRKWENNFKNTK